MRAYVTSMGSGMTLVLACLVTSVQAASPTREAKRRAAQPEAVDLFSAVGQGQIEVMFIPKDETKATLLVTNKSKKPLSVRLPEAFAGGPCAGSSQQFFRRRKSEQSIWPTARRGAQRRWRRPRARYEQSAGWWLV